MSESREQGEGGAPASLEEPSPRASRGAPDDAGSSERGALGNDAASSGDGASAPRTRATLSPHVWVPTTYFVEGYPYTIVNSLAEVLFKELGAGLGAVGLTSLLHLPWNVKFLWAPLLDRYETKRAWLVFTQLAASVVLFLLGWTTALPGLWTVVTALFVVLAILSATSDIAIDGYYMEALDGPGQSRFVGYRAMAYKLASLFVRGPVLILIGVVGWAWGLSALALVLGGFGVFHALFLPRREVRGRPWFRLGRARRRDESTAGERAEGVLSTLRTLFTLPNVFVVLAFVISFRAGESLLQKMKWPFLRDEMGLTLAEYGFANGTAGVLASFLATWWGGRLIARDGLGRWFWPFVAAQNVLNLLYVGLALLPDARSYGVGLVTLVLVIDEFGSGLGTAVLMVYLMRVCHPAHKAAHFALLTALMSLSFTFAGAVSGFLAEGLGFAGFFFLTFVATFPMMLLGRWAPHRA